MPDLLHHRERDRLLAGLRRLLRPALVEGRRLEGLAHAEGPGATGSGAALPVLDNAVAAEAMAIPALRAADPGLADAVLGFVAAMGEGAGPLPRAVAAAGTAGHVEIRRADPRDLHVLTPWHAFSGDLSRGVLRQRMRDDGAAGDLHHSGNMLRLRPRGGLAGLLGRLAPRARTLDVEEAVTAQGVEAEGAEAVMWHESALRLRAAPGLDLPLGTLRYAYRAGAADPVLRLTVTLRARTPLSALRATTALDALSGAAPPFARASIGRAGGQAPRADGPFGEDELLSGGAADSVHLLQSGPAEEALAAHLRPRAAASVFSLRLRGREGAPHWLVLRHTLPDLPAGGTATLQEDRLLARGVAPGTPEAALRLMRAPAALAGRDPGQAGIAAPLAAVAATLLNAAALVPPLPQGEVARLRDLLDRHLAALPETEDALLPVAELAPLALALDAAWRAGGLARHRRRLIEALAALAAAASPEGAIGAGLAEHGAAVLALARGAAPAAEPWLAAALHRAVMALDAGAGRSGWPGLAGVRIGPEEPDTRAVAAVLRGMRAAELAGGLDEAALARAAAVREACLRLLSARLRPHGEGLEVTAGRGRGADALSAAALLLAVMSPDEVALSRGVVAA